MPSPPPFPSIRRTPPPAALLHAIAATGYAEEICPASESNITLMDSIGRYLICRGQFEEAKKILLRTLDLATRIYKPGHQRLSMVGNSLGRAHQKLGELDEARQHFENSLNID